MRKLIAACILEIIAFLFIASSAHAWYYTTFDSESRETIARNAGEMIGFSWSPLNTVDNWTCTYDSNGSEVGYTFTNDTIWKGAAYTQCDTRNWADFYSTVNGTSGGDTHYGNDCSGFASISWKLPTRYITSDFEYDATHDGGYVTKLGEVGGGENVQLQRGDAFNKSGSHIVLFKNYRYNAYGNKAGIDAMEQTPPKARDTSELNYTDWNSSAWPWSKLTSYRPIRRNKILDNYFDSAWYSSQPVGIALDSSGYLYVADQVNHLVNKYTGSGGFVRSWSYGTPGVGYSDISKGIAVGSGYVYVADDNNTHVKKFDTNGNSASCGGTLCSATLINKINKNLT